ncbi:hypothetical protein PV433_01180 [Paenibacillus sp. GYB004]
MKDPKLEVPQPIREDGAGGPDLGPRDARAALAFVTYPGYTYYPK